MDNRSNYANGNYGTELSFSSMENSQVNNNINNNHGEDDIEWVFRDPSSTPSPSSQLSKLVSKYMDDDFIRAQLKRIKFFGSKFRSPPEIFADDLDQMALIFNPNTLKFSICYDEMKYEVLIPFHQLLGCTIKDEKMMEIRVKRESMKLFLFHPEGFPYVSSPIELDKDPTGGNFTFCERLIVKALYASDFGFLKRIKFEMRQIENTARLKRIQNMKSSVEESVTVTQRISHKVKTSVFHTIKTGSPCRFDHEQGIDLDRNSQNYYQQQIRYQSHQMHQIQQNGNPYNEKSVFFENGSVFKKSKEPEQLYVTVTFPTQRYAMFYPINGSLYYLQMQLKNRFEKNHEWLSLLYKSSNGYWDRLINEKDWQFAIHERLREKGFIRIEIYMKP